jgi:carbon storage regulator
MLVLSRKRRESIIIGGSVRVTVSAIEGSRVRLAIEAPPGVSIYRQELIDRAGGVFHPTLADQRLFPAVDEFGEPMGPLEVIDRRDATPIGASFGAIDSTPGVDGAENRLAVPLRMVLSGERRMRRRDG